VSGPLDGVRVLEFAGMGPAPFAVMMLSDMGAEVVRIDRLGARPAGRVPNPLPNPLHRGRRSVGMDLKNAAAVTAILRLAERADVLVEGFRPGTMERLGLGPDACAAVNPRLVYARVTGWGQDGPCAGLAGHDINYISVAGALARSAARAARRCPRSTSSATTAAGECSRHSGWRAPCSRPGSPGKGRSSTPR
jgi:alpha-methylacyl-CoA racemase